jgi:predicted PurR-regulated permease PerM
MKSPDAVNQPGLEDKTFLLVVVAVSVAFAFILWPFFGAVLWGVVFALVFAPLNERLVKKMRGRRALAAVTMVILIILIVILPLTLIIAALVNETAGAYRRMQSGELNFGEYFQHFFRALPAWATGLLDRFGVSDLDDVQARLSTGVTQAGRFVAPRVINLGQTTFEFFLKFFLMLYLLFFLFRDADSLSRRITGAIPLHRRQRGALLKKFAVVIRATVKGNIVVAILQGGLGGIIFWILGIRAPLLWGVLMAVLSLVPAVGAALVWFPVGVYLLATGSTWRGIVLLAFGMFVISLVDNVVRPMLVGKDTRMPDYVVLFATLGGLQVFGVSGFVLGPVIAALFIAAWDIFSTARAENHIEPVTS